jgi:hypothetical protein
VPGTEPGRKNAYGLPLTVEQYGRLAGLTNQQSEQARDGRQPYLLAHDGTTKVAALAPALLAGIERKQAEIVKQAAQEKAMMISRNTGRGKGQER